LSELEFEVPKVMKKFSEQPEFGVLKVEMLENLKS
jgi:hypothetical protein